MAKISVIVPAYNAQSFLKETLDCLKNQTLKDIEVLVVNDGSTDGTQQIIDEYCAENPNFIGLRQENGGVSCARNHGLEKATGDYVVFLDADDLFTQNSLEAFYRTAVQKDADIVLGRLRNFNEEGLGKYNPFCDELIAMPQVTTFCKTLLWTFLVGNKCYKRQRLVDSGIRFPHFRYSEEGAFFMSYVYTGAKIACTPDACMLYRRHSEQQGLSVSQTVDQPLAESMLSSLRYIEQQARLALQNAPASVDKQDYLQEITDKTIRILVGQFIRPMWQGDAACYCYCAREFRTLFERLSPARRNALMNAERDLDLSALPKTRQELLQHPSVSVIVDTKDKNKAQTILDSLYRQLNPMFEVLIPQSVCEALPQSYRSFSNIQALPDKAFIKNAKRAAKSDKKLFLRRAKAMDIRSMRMPWRLPLPEWLKALFFSPMVKGIDFLLRKKIVK